MRQSTYTTLGVGEQC